MSENMDPGRCPHYLGTGTCDGSAGPCGYAGEPLCQTNEPPEGWDGRTNRHARLTIRELRRWIELVHNGTVPRPENREPRARLLAAMRRLEQAPVEVGEFAVYGDTVAVALDGCTCTPHFGAHENYCGQEPAFGVDDIVGPLRRAGWTVTPPRDEGKR